MLLAKGIADSKVLKTYNMASEFAVRRAKGRRAHVKTGQIMQSLGAMVNILNFTYEP